MLDVFQVPVHVGTAKTNLVQHSHPRMTVLIAQLLRRKPGWFPTFGALFIYWLQIPLCFNIAESTEKHVIKNRCIWLRFPVKIN